MGFLGHNGANPGFNSFMGYQPLTGATIIVLANLNLVAGHVWPAEEQARVIQQAIFA